MTRIRRLVDLAVDTGFIRTRIPGRRSKSPTKPAKRSMSTIPSVTQITARKAECYKVERRVTDAY
jgi:hypothetical protein